MHDENIVWDDVWALDRNRRKDLRRKEWCSYRSQLSYIHSKAKLCSSIQSTVGFAMFEVRTTPTFLCAVVRPCSVLGRALAKPTSGTQCSPRSNLKPASCRRHTRFSLPTSFERHPYCDAMYRISLSFHYRHESQVLSRTFIRVRLPSHAMK